TSIGVVVSPLLYGTEKQGFIAKYGTVVAVLNIALDLALIPKHGALGAAAANCAAQIAGVVGGTFYAIRHTRTSFPWKCTAVIYSAAVLGVAPVAYLGSQPGSGVVVLSGSVALGTLVYVGLLVAAGQLGRQDFEMLKGALLPRAPRPEPLGVD